MSAGGAAAALPAAEHALGPGRNPHDPPAETLVVRVADARTGELDLFLGHRHHRVRDAGLVAELLRASR